MVPVRIFDQLCWSDAAGFPKTPVPQLQICNLLADRQSPDAQLSAQNDNLVLRAVHQLAQAAGVEPRGSFQLVKRIPIQAGLGGGSSDAAAALLLANKAWNINYSPERLAQLATGLGSDVPFFLGLGPAICRGRGEQVDPIAGLPRLHFIVIKPPAGLSTPKVFEQLSVRPNSASDRQANSAARLNLLVKALRKGAIAEAGQWMVNRLETAAEQLLPWIAQLRDVFSQLGCWAHFMTGSGTAYVGVMRSARQARIVARSISRMPIAGMPNTRLGAGNVFATSTC